MGFLVRPQSREVVSGGAYYLPCIVYSSVARPATLTWRGGNGKVLQNSSRVRMFEEGGAEERVYISRSILEISCGEMEDGMEYKCVASNGIETSQEVFVDLTFICK